MTQRKTKRTLQEIKELIAAEEDLLRPLIGAVLQEILEPGTWGGKRRAS